MPDDPLLIDRTGIPRLATTDPNSKTIRMSMAVMPPMFDQVLVHEASHVMMVETGVSDLLSAVTDERRYIIAEEMLAWFLEHHAIEVIDAVSQSLGRPACVNDRCLVSYNMSNVGLDHD